MMKCPFCDSEFTDQAIERGTRTQRIYIYHCGECNKEWSAFIVKERE